MALKEFLKGLKIARSARADKRFFLRPKGAVPLFIARAFSKKAAKPAARAALFKSAAFFAMAALCSAALFADSGLEELSGLLAKNKITRGQFALERTTAAGRALKSSGDFVICAEKGIIWKTQRPVKMTQATAAEFSVVESAGGKRTKISGAENPVYREMALLTSALWTGGFASVQEAADLRCSFDGDSWSLELVPKDASLKMALEKIAVSGTRSGGEAFVREMALFLKDGSSARYILSGHAFGGALDGREASFFD